MQTLDKIHRRYGPHRMKLAMEILEQPLANFIRSIYTLTIGSVGMSVKSRLTIIYAIPVKEEPVVADGLTSLL